MKSGQTAPSRNPITEGVIWKQILFFFFPLLVSAFFQQLYNTADALIVGRIAGKEALSAVGGPSGSLLNIFIMFFLGFSGGASVPAAQFFGAKEEDSLRNTIRASLLISCVIGLIAAVICFGGARLILTAMHTPADILAPSQAYLRIIAFGLIPCALFNMGSSILRAMGDSRRPLSVLVLTCLINIALDLLFVAALRMGASGAAAATSLCHLLSALLTLYLLKKSLDGLSLSSAPQSAVSASDEISLPNSADILIGSTESANLGLESLPHLEKIEDEIADDDDPDRDIVSSPAKIVPEAADDDDPDRDIVSDSGRNTASGIPSGKKSGKSHPGIPKDIARYILQMGIPMGFSEVAYSFANVVLMSAVTQLGTDTVAAYAAYVKIDSLFWMVVGSFGISITTFVGQNIGAGRWDRVMKSIRECSVMMFAVMGFIIFMLYYFANPLQSLFCTDPEVVRIGTQMMHFLLPFNFLYIPIEILFGSLRGMGDSIVPTLITFFGICVLRSAWGIFIVPLHHTIEMILLGFPVTWIVTDISFFIYFFMYLHKTRPQTKNN